MLTEICQYLRNWFDKDEFHNYLPNWRGTFTIADGEIEFPGTLLPGQYFRIIGSAFNDGVHKFGDGNLTDETFTGVIQSMNIPLVIIQLAQDIADWQAKYGTVSSEAMSPFQSESFGGYSYSKSGGGVGNSVGSVAGTWQGVFQQRLAPWRKI